MSRRGATLTTAPQRLLDKLFSFQYNLTHDQLQLIPATNQEGLLCKVDNEAAVLLVDDSEPHRDAFSIVSTSGDQIPIGRINDHASMVLGYPRAARVSLR